MARARNLKPQFFHDAELVECEFWVRLLFAGLWTIADREGRLPDRPKQIKINLFPADSVDVDAGLQQLADHGLIMRYEFGEVRYVQVKHFTKHQNPHYKEELSKIPPPPGFENVAVANGPSADLRREILDRDGRCLACGDTDDLTLDHITPRALGGTDARENLQTLCRRCNSAKNNRQSSSSVNATSANDTPTLAPDSPASPADSLNLSPDSLSLDSGIQSLSLARDFDDRFWTRYPKGRGVKKQALDQWRKLKPEERDAAVAALPEWLACDQWQNPAYIVHAERWLRDKRWENAPPPNLRVVTSGWRSQADMNSASSGKLVV